MKTKKRKNLFAMMMGLILELVALGILIPVTSLKVRSPKSKDDNMKVNGYFRIKGVPNLVWLHVEHGYGIFINEYVITNDGRQINLIEELSKYYWYVDRTHWCVKSGELSGRAIWRCIGSIIVYGDINQKMPKWLEVHHKWWRWCNTQETLSFVCHSKHKYFHDFINSRKSHKKGVVVYSQGYFGKMINTINSEQKRWDNISM